MIYRIITVNLGFVEATFVEKGSLHIQFSAVEWCLIAAPAITSGCSSGCLDV